MDDTFSNCEGCIVIPNSFRNLLGKGTQTLKQVQGDKFRNVGQEICPTYVKIKTHSPEMGVEPK